MQKQRVAELSCLTFRPTTSLPIRSLLARSRVGPCFPARFPVFFFFCFSRGSFYVITRCPSRDAGCHRTDELGVTVTGSLRNALRLPRACMCNVHTCTCTCTDAQMHRCIDAQMHRHTDTDTQTQRDRYARMHACMHVRRMYVRTRGWP